jgi:hypothetical protein
VALTSFLILGLTWLSAQAHHSFAVHFIPTGQARIEGTVADIRIRSPHSFLDVDVRAADGTTERWVVETHSLPLLKRVNIVDDTFEIGQKLIISGMPSRVADKPLIFGLVFETEDGARYEWAPDKLVPEGGLAQATAASGLERFEGVWGYEADPNPHTFADSSPYPLTQAGRDARAAFDPLDTPAMQCIPPNLPSMLYLPYLYGVEVDEGEVRLHHEYYAVLRTVPLGGAPAQTEPSGQFGQASARVQGDTLVVESSGFPELRAGLATDFDPNGLGGDIPSSDQKQVTERYTLSDDGQILFVNYTIVDPVYLTQSYSSQTQWQRLADGTRIEAFDCDLEIAAQSAAQGEG